MKSFVLGLALCAAAFPALAQTNVSVTVGQPGFYGRIDLGDFAGRPVLYGPQPVIVTRGPHYIAEPVYLRVPVEHRRHWGRWCGRYGACGRPVYFVRDEWYRNTYVPRWHQHYGHRPDFRGPPPRPPVYVIDRGHRGPEHHGRGPDHWRGPEHHGRGPEHHGHGPDRDHGHGHGRGHDDRGHGR
nr:hypothetical protein [uncultured Massilia sp.]